METFSRETSGLHPWFVTGFAEGAGTFTYSRSGGNLSLYFAVKAAAADGDLLARTRGFFDGAGKVYPVRSRQPRGSAEGAPAGGYYRIAKIKDLGRVIDHFDAFPLRGSKRRSYAIWRKMVRLKSERFRRPDRERLGRLAQELSAAAPRSNPPKA